MPEEIMVIIIVALISLAITITSVVKTVMRHKYGEQQKGAKLDTTASQSSMKTSELKAMLRETVTEATQPLVERIEMLEEWQFQDSNMSAIEAPHTEPLLDLPEESVAEDLPQRRRTR